MSTYKIPRVSSIQKFAAKCDYRRLGSLVLQQRAASLTFLDTFSFKLNGDEWSVLLVKSDEWYFVYVENFCLSWKPANRIMCGGLFVNQIVWLCSIRYGQRLSTLFFYSSYSEQITHSIAHCVFRTCLNLKFLLRLFAVLLWIWTMSYNWNNSSHWIMVHFFVYPRNP